MRQLSINNKKSEDYLVTQSIKVNKIDLLKIGQFLMFLCLIATNIIVFFMNSDLFSHLLPATIIVIILFLAKNLEFNTTYNKN